MQFIGEINVFKSEKMESIRYFLCEVLNEDYPLEVRKEEMLKVGSKFCQGFPEWSDWWGNELKAIDSINKNELREHLKNFK